MGSSISARFGRYLVVGGIGTLIHFLSTIALVESGWLAPVPASVAGFALTLLVSFLLNNYWTFERVQRPLVSFNRYVLVSLSGLVLNALLMYSVTELLALHYLWGLLLVVLVVPPWNFSLNLLWSFR